MEAATMILRIDDVLSSKAAVVYPEEIVEMANLLMKDIADSKDNIVLTEKD